ncbi:MAG: hypothetical protein RL215_1878, partial [Planctomycetota bacterium]
HTQIRKRRNKSPSQHGQQIHEQRISHKTGQKTYDGPSRHARQKGPTDIPVRQERCKTPWFCSFRTLKTHSNSFEFPFVVVVVSPVRPAHPAENDVFHRLEQVAARGKPSHSQTRQNSEPPCRLLLSRRQPRHGIIRQPPLVQRWQCSMHSDWMPFGAIQRAPPLAVRSTTKAVSPATAGCNAYPAERTSGRPSTAAATSAEERMLTANGCQI